MAERTVAQMMVFSMNAVTKEDMETRNGLLSEVANRIQHYYGKTDGSVEFPNSAEGDLLKMVYTAMTKPTPSLEERMKQAGMIPLSELFANPGVGGPFAAHTGVTDLDAYEQWLQMRYEETAKARVRLELDKKTDDEMFEWYMSHQAAFGEALANFKTATGR